MQIPAGLMVRDARLDGQPVSLVEGPPPHVLLSRAGRVVLTLDIVMPLDRVGRHRIDRAAGVAVADLARRADAAAKRRRSLGRRRLRRRARRVAGREPMDGVRPAEPAADAVVEAQGRRSPGGAAAAHARARDDDGRARRRRLVRWPRRCASKCCRGSRARSRCRFRAGLVVNQVNGATVGDWDAAGGTLRVRLLEPVATETSFVVQGETRAPRDGAVAVPLCACRPPSARPAASPSTSSAPARSPSAQARGLEPADPSELGEIVAGRESPSMIAFRLRPLAGSEPRSLAVTVVRYTPQAVLDRQRRGGALSRARLRRRRPARRGALRGAQQPAQLPEGDDAAGFDGVERGGRRPADPAGRRRARCRAAAARKGTRRRRGADVRRRAGVPAARSTRGPTRGGRASICRRSICRCRAPASSCTTRRASGSSRSRARSASRAIPVRSPRRCAQPPTPVVGRQSRRAPGRSAPRPDCRRSSIVSETRPAAARVVGALPVHVTFPAFGPSMFLASELTAEATRAVGRARVQADAGTESMTA